MQMTGFAGWRNRGEQSQSSPWKRREASYFDTHPIGEIVRGLVFSSVLWGLLAVGVYTVYAMVLGTH